MPRMLLSLTNQRQTGIQGDAERAGAQRQARSKNHNESDPTPAFLQLLFYGRARFR